MRLCNVTVVGKQLLFVFEHLACELLIWEVYCEYFAACTAALLCFLSLCAQSSGMQINQNVRTIPGILKQRIAKCIYISMSAAVHICRT